MDSDELSAIGLALGMGTMGALHLLKPDQFDALIPRWMPGKPRRWTYLSGVAELVGAGLVAREHTRRLGGYWCAATMAAVFPANVQAALDGGMSAAPPPFDSAVVAWARLPFQVPMIRHALNVARSARPQR